MKSAGKLIWILVILSIQLLPAQYRLEKLGPEINTDQYDEISPVLTRDGRTLYFTRIGAPQFNRTLIQEEVDLSKILSETEYLNVLKKVYSQIAKQEIKEPVKSSINQDIWIVESRNSPFDRVFQPGFPINSALPNSVCSLSPNDSTLVILNQFARDGSMFKGFSFIDRKADGSFSFPEPLHIHDFYSNSNGVYLCMNKLGDVVVLSLNRPDSRGDNDLYVSFKIKYNLWSEPINLGPVINSTAREITPYISEDKSRLYFASNRSGGLGGSDLYVSLRLDYTWLKWSQPERLKEPINSINDDSSPCLVGPYLYFTSMRDGTSDIFRTDLNTPATNSYQPIVLRGTLKNHLTQELMPAELSFGLSTDPSLNQVYSSMDGRFEIVLDKPGVYRLQPLKPEFIGKGQLINATQLNQTGNRTYEIDFYMTPLVDAQKIEVDHIYFKRGRSIVLPKSYSELDRLNQLMNQNPRMNIRIEGHTDSVGNYYELLDLSRARAEEIKKYLVNKGIVSARISTEGFGGTRPISKNNSEENRAKNRRVDFFITYRDQAAASLHVLPNPELKPIRETSRPASDPMNARTLKPLPDSSQVKSSAPYIPSNTPSMPARPSAEKKEVLRIVFLPNELVIEDSSFAEINKLIDFLISNPAKKIILIGKCKGSESVSNPVLFANQRAKGIKEFFVFKSIAPERIFLDDRDPDPQEISGVKVFIKD